MNHEESKIEKHDEEDLFLTIPQNILEKLNLQPGDEVEINLEDDKIVIKKSK